MAVGLTGLPTLHAVGGVRLGATAAGIRKRNRDDLLLFEIASGAIADATFTRNAFCAAPVTIARRHLELAPPRYLLINSGNANAGTGKRGLDDARATCQAVADMAGCRIEQVLPFSTGVIGEALPVDRITAALPAARERLSEEGWADAARAIMTTDTVPKGASRRFDLDGSTVTVTGIAKGAGMIHPNMATMLAFIATDAAIEPGPLRRLLADAVAATFNSITVDGDTSTNDACILIASGASGHAPIDTRNSPAYRRVFDAVLDVCTTLAHAIVRDGEGATKFITIDVQNGHDADECRRVADAVALSPLVKTALFASDPNWGRVLAAVGRAGVTDLDIDKVTIRFNEVTIVTNGARAPDYTEEAGQRVFARPEITIHIDLGRGNARARVWTCDFSEEYVRINAEYRT